MPYISDGEYENLCFISREFGKIRDLHTAGVTGESTADKVAKMQWERIQADKVLTEVGEKICNEGDTLAVRIRRLENGREGTQFRLNEATETLGRINNAVVSHTPGAWGKVLPEAVEELVSRDKIAYKRLKLIQHAIDTTRENTVLVKITAILAGEYDFDDE